VWGVCIQSEIFCSVNGLPADTVDDDVNLGHAKRYSRTQVYAGKKVHYLTGLLILTVQNVSCFHM